LSRSAHCRAAVREAIIGYGLWLVLVQRGRSGAVDAGRQPSADRSSVSALRDLESADRLEAGVGVDSPSQPTAGVPHYVSADTAPAGYAVGRSAWTACAFLSAFAVLSVGLVPLLDRLAGVYGAVLGAVVGVPADGPAVAGSLGLRPFVAVLLALLAAFAVGGWRDRVRMLGFMWVLYFGGVLALDSLLLVAAPLGAPAPLSPVPGLATGLVGLVVVVLAIFTQYRLPAGVRVARRRRRPPTDALILVAALAGGLAISSVGFAALWRLGRELALPLAGGVESRVVLFSLAVITVLYLLSVVQRRADSDGDATLSVAFLVPAYNEAEGIADCIQALDRAAASYRGPCRLYLVDNDSVDGTRAVAARVLAGCSSIAAEVLLCRERGKSRALNFGLQRISEDVIVRVDADTVVSPSLLRQLVPYFQDPTVGGVSGMSVPRNPRSWLGCMRLIEVYYNIAFVRSAQSAVDVVMVMPGVLASYRRDLVVELGGFGEGFNGEDADITVRIGRLGYRIVNDPRILVQTEMPATFAHLREQRQRWARGLFHMAARNLSIISMRQGLRGLMLLPWSILNASRRSLTMPVLVCAPAVELADPTVFSMREICLVTGAVLSLQLAVICVLLLAHRQFRALLTVPSFLAFRVFRAYVTLESLLTLRLRPSSRRPATRRPLAPCLVGAEGDAGLEGAASLSRLTAR
jgi:cellulose synthase/poly-beta-1,6-N-acetylglucosamine synthase-like glycosyltransferase